MPCPPLSQEAARVAEEKAALEAEKVREDALADLLQPKEGLAFMEVAARRREMLDPPLGQMFEFDFPDCDLSDTNEGETGTIASSGSHATAAGCSDEMPPLAKSLLAKMVSVLASSADARNRLQEIYAAPFAVKGFKGDIQEANEFVMYIVEDERKSGYVLCFDTPQNFKNWLKYSCIERMAYKNEEKRQWKLLDVHQPQKQFEGNGDTLPRTSARPGNTMVESIIGPKSHCNLPADRVSQACQETADKAVASAIQQDSAKVVAQPSAKSAWKQATEAYIPVPGVSDIVELLDVRLMDLPPLSGFNVYELPGVDLTGIRAELTMLAASIDCDLDILGPAEGLEDVQASHTILGKLALERPTALRFEPGANNPKRDLETLLDWLRQILLGKDSVHAAINQLTDEHIIQIIQDSEAFFKSRRALELVQTHEARGAARVEDFGSPHLAASFSLNGWSQGPIEELLVSDKNYLRVVYSRRKSLCGCITMAVETLPLYFYASQRPAVERLINFDAVGRSYYSEVPPHPRKMYDSEADVGGDELPPTAPHTSGAGLKPTTSMPASQPQVSTVRVQEFMTSVDL